MFLLSRRSGQACCAVVTELQMCALPILCAGSQGRRRSGRSHRVRQPAAANAVPADAAGGAIRRGGRKGEPGMSGATILVADDDRAIRTVLTQALGRQGHVVRTTGNASTLWQWVKEGEGDLVITDVVMPDENGLDLVPRIRSEEHTSELK